MTVQTTQTPRGYAPGNVAQAQDAAVFERSGAGVYLTMEWIAAYIQAALGNGSAISFGTVNPANTAGEQNDIFFNVITGEVLSKGVSAWTTQANFALDTEVTAAIAAAITAHVGATDPHPIYLTQAEATALYKPLTTDDSVATGLRFALKTATTGTPGNGEIQFNNATLTGVTQLLISEVDRDGSTIPTLLDMLQQTTRIIIQVEQAEGLYVWFSITGAIVDNGSYRTVPVAFVTAPTGVTTISGLGASGTELTLDFYGAGSSGLTIREIDGTPSILATVLEIPNTLLSDQGGGVARLTIPPVTGGGGLTWSEQPEDAAISPGQGFVATGSADKFYTLSATAGAADNVLIIQSAGVGTGIWSAINRTVYAPDGSFSTSGVRRLSTHPYASVTLKPLAGAVYAIQSPMVGIELIPNAPSAYPFTHFWKLEESSGNRLDSVGNIPLISSATVIRVAGKIQFGVDCQTGDNLTALNADLRYSGSGDYFFSCWFNVNDTSNNTIASVYDANVNGEREWWVYTTNNNINLQIFTPTSRVVSINNLATSNNWHWLAFWLDSTTNRIYLRLDTTETFLQLNSGELINPSASTFRVGSGIVFNYGGLLDAIGLGTTVPSGTQLANLYNSGNGYQVP